MSVDSTSRYPPDWDTRRRQVYQRDDYRCQRCGIRGGPHGDVELHAHHVVPISNGGSHELTNLLTLCWSCHNAVHDHYVPRASALSPTERQTADHEPITPQRDGWDRDDWFLEVLDALDPAEYTAPSRPYVEYWIALLRLYDAIINVHEGRYRETYERRDRLAANYWARTGEKATALLAAARDHQAVVDRRFEAFAEAHEAVHADLHRHADFVYERTETYVEAIRGWTEAIEGIVTADSDAQARECATEFATVTYEYGEPVGPDRDPPWLNEMIDLINDVGANIRTRIEPATDPDTQDCPHDDAHGEPPAADAGNAPDDAGSSELTPSAGAKRIAGLLALLVVGGAVALFAWDQGAVGWWGAVVLFGLFYLGSRWLSGPPGS